VLVVKPLKMNMDIIRGLVSRDDDDGDDDNDDDEWW
jgi:hypothetical protein